MPDTQRKGVALALLAIPASAIVTVAENESTRFTPWEIMIGLLIVSLCLAYRSEVGSSFFEELAFSIMLSAGVVFMVEMPLELWLDARGDAFRHQWRDWFIFTTWLGSTAIAMFFLRFVAQGTGRRS